MKTNERTEQFLERLRAVSKEMSHDELADYLSTPKVTFQNWLYRDKPNRFAVALLKPLVDRKWRTLQRKP